MANILQNHGYNVVVASLGNLRLSVQSQGFRFHSLTTVAFGMGVEIHLANLKKSREPYLDSLLYRVSNKLYHERAKELTDLLRAVKPDVILLDSFLSTDFVILYPWLKQHGTKCFFVQTMLSTRLNLLAPPLFSGLLPTNRKNVEKSWKTWQRQKAWLRVRDCFKYLGKDDLSLIRKALKTNKVPDTFTLDVNRLFHVGFSNVPELILAPLELEFSADAMHPDLHYVGSLLTTQREETQSNPDCMGLLEKIVANNGDRKTIYCSFGTLYTHETASSFVVPFLQRLVAVVAANPNYQLILSLQSSYWPSIGPFPSNVHVFNHVPQLQLLPLCDLFVTQGGLNSVKEGIHFEVPMYVCPPNINDQAGNAARAEFYQLGVQGSLVADSEFVIAHKIADLLSNPVYKKSLRNFNRDVKEKYSDENFLSKFEHLLRDSGNIS